MEAERIDEESEKEERKMKLVINRAELSKEFSAVAAWAPSRSPMDILTNVKMMVRGSVVSLEATDSQTGVHGDVYGVLSVDGEGDILLPVSRVSSILREASGDYVTIEWNGSNSVDVRVGSASYKIPFADPDKFPSVTFGNADARVVVSSESLAMALGRVLYAANMGSARYATVSVKIEKDGSDLVLIAADGSRMAVQRIEAKEWSGGDLGEHLLVPLSTARSIQRTLPKEGDVEVMAGSNRIDCVSGGRRMYSSILEGKFPPWRRMLESLALTGNATSVVSELQQAVRQAGVVTDRESRAIGLKFSEGEVTLSASTAEVGESRVVSPVVFSGEEMELRAAYQFVSEALRVLEDESVVNIGFSNREGPIVFSCDGYTAVVSQIIVS